MAIAEVLRARARWVLWKNEEVNGKITKVPYIAHQDKTNKADVTNGANWSSYDRAIDCLNSRNDMNGLGYCLLEDDNKAFFDFDHCLVDGKVDPEVDAIVRELESYTEISQSGKGLHVVVGTPGPNFDIKHKIKNHHAGIDYETYIDGRYIAITGNVLDGYSDEVKDNPSAAENVWRAQFMRLDTVESTPKSSSISNSDLLELMMVSKNGAAIRNLYNGVSSSGDDSADDMALMNHLAYWTNKDPSKMEDMFRESTLGQRRKCVERRDYVQRTVQVAIRDCKNTVGDVSRIDEETPYPLNQIGFVDRLLELEKDRLRFCVDTKSWHICQEGVWKQSTVQQAACYTEDLYQDLLKLSAEDVRHRDLYLKAAKNVSDYGVSVKVLNRLSGRDKMIIRLKQLDIKDHYLVVGNGVVNLENGELEDVNPQDFHTLFTEVDYVKAAKCSKWLKFLSEIFPGDDEIIGFIQRAMGMSLFGDETERFFICYGEGANGKSVFLDVCKTILQYYAEKASIQTFVSKNEDAGKARSDIVRLVGKRLIVASENKKEVMLDTGLIKEWSGDKDIVARGLYASEIRFEPRGSLWFATNHKPIIEDDTDGTWRRCIMVPFMTTIPEEQRNPHLSDELLAEESEGILAWMIQGAVDFHAEGLQVPAVVVEATEEYKEEQLPLLQFVREELMPTIDADSSVGWTDLTKRMVKWQMDNEMPMNPAADKKALVKVIQKRIKTAVKVRANSGQVVKGIQFVHVDKAEA
jgi:putative DNA primase/helicase